MIDPDHSSLIKTIADYFAIGDESPSAKEHIVFLINRTPAWLKGEEDIELRLQEGRAWLLELLPDGPRAKKTLEQLPEKMRALRGFLMELFELRQEGASYDQIVTHFGFD